MDSFLEVWMEILHQAARCIITLQKPASCRFFPDIQDHFPVAQAVKETGESAQVHPETRPP